MEEHAVHELSVGRKAGIVDVIDVVSRYDVAAAVGALSRPGLRRSDLRARARDGCTRRR